MRRVNSINQFETQPFSQFEMQSLAQDISASSDYSRISEGAYNHGTERIKKKSNVGVLFSLGGVSLLMAIHYVGNGLILSHYGDDGERAAVSLINGIQSVASGSVYGALLITGLKINPLMLEGDFIGVGSIVKISWISGVVMGTISSGGVLIMHPILQHIAAFNTAAAVNNYFSIYAIGGAILEPFVASNGIILSLLDNKNWIPPLVSMAVFRLASLSLGYYFFTQKRMGPAGLSLGTIIAAAITNLGIHLLLVHKKYSKYGLYTLQLPYAKMRIKSFLSGAWRLSLYKLSEWGNLMALSLALAKIDDAALRAETPFSQINTLIGFSVHGMAAGAMIFIGQDVETAKNHYKNFTEILSEDELEKYLQVCHTNKLAFHKANAISAILAISLGLAAFLTCQYNIPFFTGRSVSAEEYNLSETIMNIGLLGILPDAIRIMSSGLLRGWQDLIFPTLVYILTVTIAAVSIGTLLSIVVYDNNPQPLFWARSICILLAVVANYYRFFWKHIPNDLNTYTQGKIAIDLFSALGPNIGQVEQRQLTLLPERLRSVAKCYGDIFTVLSLSMIDLDEKYTVTHLKKLLALEIANNFERYKVQLKITDPKELIFDKEIERNSILCEMIRRISGIEVFINYDEDYRLNTEQETSHESEFQIKLHRLTESTYVSFSKIEPRTEQIYPIQSSNRHAFFGASNRHEATAAVADPAALASRGK